ncbi:hypothetical protein MBLNU230_g1299t1 [Neophaeotheca triangularis]
MEPMLMSHCRYGLDRDVLKDDLTNNKPSWPLSCYSPAKEGPRHLFEGEIEVSPEEARLKFYLARAQGNEQRAIQEEQQAVNQVTSQIQTALNNLDGAIDYVIQGKDIHPNRFDICEEGSKASKQGASAPGMNGGGASAFGQPSAPSAFGQPASTSGTFGKPSNQGSAFGQPSQPAFGQPSNSGGAFGKPSFGQPSQPSALGQSPQPSALGQSSQPSAFGQPSQPSTFGQPAQASAFGKASQSSAFGQPSQPSAFGQPSQPSAFGQSSQPSAFGQPSKPAASQSTFGQPSNPSSTFGQPSNPTSAFGQPSKPGVSPFAAADQRQGSPFGQAAQNPSPFAQTSQNQQQPAQPAFGQPSQPSAFGQPSNPAAIPSPFGAPSQPSAFGQPSNPAAKPSPFAAAGQQSNSPFGAPTGSKAASPFSQSSAFGQPSQQSAFGQPSQPQQATSTFGQPSQPASQPNGFGQPPFNTQPTDSTVGPANSSENIATPPVSSYAQHGANKQLTRWKGQSVRYVPESRTKENAAVIPVFNDPASDGREIRIWNPDGPPEQISKDVEAKDASVYELGDLAAVLKDVYSHMNATAEFKDGLMPEIPPKSEWIGWDV